MPFLEVYSTCVRVPICYGHGVSVYVETEEDIEIDKIISLIKETDKNLSNIIKLSVIDVFKDNYNDLTKKVYLNKMDNLN